MTAVARAAKRHWGYPETWLAAWRNELTVDPDFIADEPVFVALGSQNEIVGFYALRDVSAGCELEHFWVLPEAMGRGIGRALFEHAVAQARGAGCQVLHIDADPHAAGFYERMGAEPAGTVSAPMDGHPRVRPQYKLRLSADGHRATHGLRHPPADADDRDGSTDRRGR
ncbi:MAG: GNAT family N-acetyltransferase [Gemmatimonadota bacterium]|nr:MAG: GNAT family N-acetyltransferase [Gemmatimonadota bacterium]